MQIASLQFPETPQSLLTSSSFFVPGAANNSNNVAQLAHKDLSTKEQKPLALVVDDVADDPDRERSDECVPDLAAPAREGGAADNHRGDRVKFRELAEGGRARGGAACREDRGHARG